MAEETKWYQIDVEDVFKTLDADQKGLPNEEAKKRLEKYGRNEVEQKRTLVGLRSSLTNLSIL